jgi:hypothetical protein
MASGIPPPTIKRLEAAEGLLGGWETTVQKIGNSLKKAGVEFIAENVPDCACAKASGRNPLIPRLKAASARTPFSRILRRSWGLGWDLHLHRPWHRVVKSQPKLD